MIQYAKQYNTIGVLFCYDLQNVTNGTKTTDNAIKLITDHPRILMYDINTINDFIPEITALIPTYEIIIQQQRIKTWFKIDYIENITQIGETPIKADKIEGLEFRTYH